MRFKKYFFLNNTQSIVNNSKNQLIWVRIPHRCIIFWCFDSCFKRWNPVRATEQVTRCRREVWYSCLSEHRWDHRSNRWLQGSQPWVIPNYAVGTANSQDHLKRYGIKSILAGVKHPRTNAKLERFFGSLQELQDRFSIIRSFLKAGPTIQGYFKKEKS